MAETDGAKIIVLRDAETGQLEAVAETEETVVSAQRSAAHRKAVFQYRLAGAQTRAGALPRQLTAAFASGTVNLMLAKLLQEEIVAVTAKEAAEVAKVAHEIFKSAAGQPKNGRDLTPEERQRREDEIVALERTLMERAKAASAQLSGAPKTARDVETEDVDEDPNAWEHDPA
jgi:hypothetical protein